MEKLVIDRAKWYRGHNSGSKLLRKDDDCMCCLGFDLLRRGFTTEEIFDVPVPENVTSPDADNFQEQLAKLDGLVYLEEDCGCDGPHISPTDINAALVSVNDDICLDEPTREAKLTELFAQIGIAVEFVGVGWWTT